jgi:hypothetical protein
MSGSVASGAEHPACRKFTLADSLIFIAGLAIVLSMGAHLLKFATEYFLQICRVLVVRRAELWENWPPVWRAIREPLRQLVSYGFQCAGTLLFGVTPIFLILRMRRPRPVWRVLFVQPGVVAGLAMVFGFFWVAGLVQIVFPDRLDSITGPWIAVGGTVAVAWLVLAASGNWIIEPGWVDRLGVLLGAAAIATALLGLAVYRI